MNDVDYIQLDHLKLTNVNIPYKSVTLQNALEILSHVDLEFRAFINGATAGGRQV